MKRALTQARQSIRGNDVPVGCVIVKDGELIASGYNRRDKDRNVLRHCELIAIQKACRKLGDWRLEGCTLYVTLEPCPMCAGAIVQARLDRVVIGATNPKAGCAGSVLDLLQQPGLNHRVMHTEGVLEKECAELLTSFFQMVRRRRSYETILFDLDGTLINSYPGIRHCTQYALEKLRRTVDPQKLPLFVGPPLEDSFMRYAGMDQEEADRAVAYYRERYRPIGIRMYETYAGATACLRELSARGKRLILATGKPQEMAEQILEWEGWTSYFTRIVGSDKAAGRYHKEEIVEEILRQEDVDLSKVVLVGDTIFDLKAARHHGMDCILLTHGFGAKKTHRMADAMVDSMEELYRLLK